MKMGKKANWVTIEIDNAFVLIRDIGPWDTHLSVTNDAENVVKEVVATGYLGDRKLFYVDSDGRTDRLLVKNGEFDGYSREELPERTPKDYAVVPPVVAPRDENAFWNKFRKNNPNWRGD
jgi:hypothetical protein